MLVLLLWICSTVWGQICSLQHCLLFLGIALNIWGFFLFLYGFIFFCLSEECDWNVDDISLKLEIIFSNIALPEYWLCQYISTESISHIPLCSSICFLQYFNCIVILPSSLGLFLDFCCFELLWMGCSPLIPVPKHMCVHGVCMCMNMCVQPWKPEVDAKCPSHHSPSYLIGTPPFIVTWRLLFQLHCWLVSPRLSSF